jgi:hypothetical protein
LAELLAPHRKHRLASGAKRWYQKTAMMLPQPSLLEIVAQFEIATEGL